VRTKETGFGGLKTDLLNILIGFIYFLIPFTFVSEKFSFAIVWLKYQMWIIMIIHFHYFTCRDTCLDASYNIRHAAISSCKPHLLIVEEQNYCDRGYRRAWFLFVWRPYPWHRYQPVISFLVVYLTHTHTHTHTPTRDQVIPEVTYYCIIKMISR